jgi:hypothetical protein
MKILCTGNPSKLTIAWAVKQKWPNAQCISLSSGWNLKWVDDTSRSQFKELVTQFDVFINSSFIAPGVQADILNLVVQKWTEADIKGHVITIGTTLENYVDTKFQTYINDKKKLRELSLLMNDRTGITGVKTSYVVVGGINNQQPQNADFVDPQSVVELIDWVLKFPNQLALIQLEKSKT